jgi:hypothetical protein
VPKGIYRFIYRPRRRQEELHRFLAKAKATARAMLFEAQARTDPQLPVDPRALASH